MMGIYKQVIIIPAYQPSDKLIVLVEQLTEVFENIIVVDDGSGEEYGSIFEKIENNRCILLRHAVNQGKGRALKTAFNYCLNTPAFAEHGCITVDGDGQHTLSDIVSIAEELKKNQESVIFGYRRFDDKSIPFRSRMGNNISRVIYKWACGIDLKDTQTGLRGLPYSFLEDACAIEGERYEYETNMLISIKDCQYKIHEIPIETIYEDGNKESHFSPLRDSIKIYLVIIKYCLSSVVTVIMDYIIFAILLSAGISIVAGTYLSRVCAAVFNFSINRNVVFKYKGNILVQFIKYSGLVFVSGTISGFVIRYLAELTAIPVLLCKIIVETLLFFANYYIQSRYIFVKEK